MVLIILIVAVLLICCMILLYEIRERVILAIFLIAFNDYLSICLWVYSCLYIDQYIPDLYLWGGTILVFCVLLFLYVHLYLDIDPFSTFVTQNIEETKKSSNYAPNGKFVPNSTMKRWLPVDK